MSLIFEIVSVAVIIGIILYIVSMYNYLISRQNNVSNAFASIDALLKKRYDLIPNLVIAVSKYMNYERDVFTKITELRTKALSGKLSLDEKNKTDIEMGKLIKGILVSVENYPDLKTSINFLNLQASLNETKEQISAGRRAFNATVTEYNNAVRMFPTNIMAGMMGFGRKSWFEVSQDERNPIKSEDIMNEKICPNCGQKNSSTAKFCRACGFKLS